MLRERLMADWMSDEERNDHDDPNRMRISLEHPYRAKLRQGKRGTE